MGLGMIGMVLFWALAILAIVALVRWLVGGFGRRRETLEKSALDLLKERYARGEIGREEFTEKRSELEP